MPKTVQNENLDQAQLLYLLEKMRNDTPLVEAVENLIVQTFVESLDCHVGIEHDLIHALLTARRELQLQDDDEEDLPELLTPDEAEKYFIERQKAIYAKSGHKTYAAHLAEEIMWPDALPLHADWDADILGTLAEYEAAHDACTRDAIIRYMAEAEKTNDRTQPTI